MKRILLIDDDPGVIATTGRILQHAGYDVHKAATAEMGQDMLRKGDFELVITDIHMPGKGGLELLRTRELDKPQVPVILITGRPSVATAVDALRLAAIDYLIKPLQPEELIERVSQAIEKGQARRVVSDAHQRASQITKLLGALESALDTSGPGGPNAVGEQAGRDGAPLDPLSNLTSEEITNLSRREREVLQKLVDGLSTTDAARALFVSPHTLRNHLKSIYRKLGVHSRVELMRRLLGAPR